jgi:KEOPS complex subunit Cgi121
MKIWSCEGGKAVSILGFRDIKLDDADRFLKTVRVAIRPATIQMVDAKRVAGERHLFFDFINAQKAFKQGGMISEKLEVETLLYASGQRQIARAIEMLGIKPMTSEVATIIIASNEEEVEKAKGVLTRLVFGIRDDRTLEIRGESKADNIIKTFGITEHELEAMNRSRSSKNEVISWLVVERVALLAATR